MIGNGLIRAIVLLCTLSLGLTVLSCSERESTQDQPQTTGGQASDVEQVAPPSSPEGESTDTHEIVKPPSEYGSDLDEQPARETYLAFGDETVSTYRDFGIYYDKAEAGIIGTGMEEDPLRVDFTLPPFHEWGNWLSIRREFKAPLDLAGWSGIELDLKVEESCEAMLRFTLCDLAQGGAQGRHRPDEMWWYDFDETVLAEAGGWLTLHAPFKGFRLAYGEGTRANDRHLDLSQIVAYEINLVSKPGKVEEGTILVKAVRPYME